MRTSILLVLAAAALGVSAQDFDDIPSQCMSQCNSITQTAQDCDRRYDNDDFQNDYNDNDDNNYYGIDKNDIKYLDCLCSTGNNANQLSSCESCVSQVTLDNDYRELVMSCAAYSSMGGSPSIQTSAPTGQSSSSTGTARATPTSLSPNNLGANNNNNGQGSQGSSTGGNAASGLALPSLGAFVFSLVAAVGFL